MEKFFAHSALQSTWRTKSYKFFPLVYRFGFYSSSFPVFSPFLFLWMPKNVRLFTRNKNWVNFTRENWIWKFHRVLVKRFSFHFSFGTSLHSYIYTANSWFPANVYHIHKYLDFVYHRFKIMWLTYFFMNKIIEIVIHGVSLAFQKSVL